MLPTNTACEHGSMINAVQNAPQPVKVALTWGDTQQFLSNLRNEGYEVRKVSRAPKSKESPQAKVPTKYSILSLKA